MYDRFDSHRAAFHNFTGFGKKVAAAALSLAVSTLFNKAYGQAALDATVAATLNLTLQLGCLEKYYYQRALASNILDAEQTGAMTIILNDENLHIKTLLGVLGASAIPDPTRAGFDYTGSQGGQRAALFPTLGNTFTSTADFLMVGQQFVDTGVHACKGGTTKLIMMKDVLGAALNIHSVEAWHSSRIRSLRRGGIQSVTAPKAGYAR